MGVYVLTSEPYHDNSTIYGVFTTIEAAKARCPDIAEWEDVTPETRADLISRGYELEGDNTLMSIGRYNEPGGNDPIYVQRYTLEGPPVSRNNPPFSDPDLRPVEAPTSDLQP